jgi:predicted RNA-binding Zn-ribbon protein involved in translation (DUF1610 family)
MAEESAKGFDEGLKRGQAIMDSIREIAEVPRNILTGFHCPMCGSPLEHINIDFTCTKDGMSFEIRIGTKNGHAEVIVRSL